MAKAETGSYDKDDDEASQPDLEAVSQDDLELSDLEKGLGTKPVHEELNPIGKQLAEEYAAQYGLPANYVSYAVICFGFAVIDHMDMLAEAWKETTANAENPKPYIVKALFAYQEKTIPTGEMETMSPYRIQKGVDDTTKVFSERLAAVKDEEKED